jgi:hypothetical protein
MDANYIIYNNKFKKYDKKIKEGGFPPSNYYF